MKKDGCLVVVGLDPARARPDSTLESIVCSNVEDTVRVLRRNSVRGILVDMSGASCDVLELCLNVRDVNPAVPIGVVNSRGGERASIERVCRHFVDLSGSQSGQEALGLFVAVLDKYYQKENDNASTTGSG